MSEPTRDDGDSDGRPANRQDARTDRQTGVSSGSRPHAAVRRATGPRYGKAGARRDVFLEAGQVITDKESERAARARHGVAEPAPARPAGKNRIHSVLSALPVLMLIAGLYYHFSGESAQKKGSPLFEQSVQVGARFEGLSVVKSGGVGRHYLWFDDGERRRGARVKARDVASLASLRQGDQVELSLAPTVDGSTTLWAWRVERGAQMLLDTRSLATE